MSEDDEPAPPTRPLGPTRPAGPKRARCPVCGKPQVARHRPFCSERCATIDLARWLGGSYRIPLEDQPTGDEDSDDHDPYKDIDD